MTDKELDSVMRQILLDAIALDEESCEDRIPFEPSLKYQHQTALMLKGRRIGAGLYGKNMGNELRPFCLWPLSVLVV